MVKIKICGLTNGRDAQIAAQAGVDFLGFIFYKPSPRYVSPETVKEIVTDLRKMAHPPVFVGVFVSASLKSISQIVDKCQLDIVQLHGDEPPEFVQHFRGRAYKALRPQTLAEAEHLIQPYLPCPPLPLGPCFLLDAYHPTLYGGTGQRTDWTMAAKIAQKYPIMLAGSLNPTNIVQAIQNVQPWGVDVSSGIEAEKGKKSPEKLRTFIKIAQNIDN